MPDNWDFGKDDTGNVMTYDNLKYYYDKYGGVDCVIGDCGVPWNSSNSVKSLSVYQLLYGILIPRKGGNFIAKTFATNYDSHYLSLLYTAINRRSPDTHVLVPG